MSSNPPANDAPQCALENEGADHVAGVGDTSFKAKARVKPQHEEQMQDTNNESSLEPSTTALDIEEGGGGGGGGDANGSISVGSDDSSTAENDLSKIAAAAAAFEPSPPVQGGATCSRSSGNISTAKKPPTNGASSRTRSSFSHKDPAVRRRSSKLIATERRAEAQKAAATAALGAAAGGGGGLVYANRSNQSRSSLRSVGSNTSTSGLSKTKSEDQSQWDESAKAVVGAAIAGASSAGAPAGNGSSSGLPPSNDSQPHQAAVETAPVDSMTTNGGGGDDSHNEKVADGAPAKGGEGSGTTAALSDIGHAPSFRLVRVDGSTITRKTCLNTKYSLRRQLFLSFGTVSAVALMLVVLVAIITTTLAGNQVKYSS